MNAPRFHPWLIFYGLCLLPSACRQNHQVDAAETPTVTELNLKRGNLSVCGPAEQQFGRVAFEVTAPRPVQADFTLAVSLLHSFEYDEAEKVFARIIDRAPDCAMAYWGVAMCSYHPLWTPPSPAELAKGARAVALARRLPKKTARESAYIEALAVFYQDYAHADHRTRSGRFEQAMAQVAARFPTDKEAAIFYALALDAAADPADKTFRKQRKAGAILEGLQPQAPGHPGIVHYLIHTYDYPELAALALPAARQYASVAPSSAHALHMPSHIFTRLGLWNECISSNLAAASSARCYAENAGLRVHWDEELHSIDYLAYAYLQQGDNPRAREQRRYLASMQEVSPVTFKVAYAFAAVPARYVLENKQWAEATRLRPQRANLDWAQYPWQRAITHFARALGYAHTQQPDSAQLEIDQLSALCHALAEQHDDYKARQVEVQLLAAEAWLALARGQSGAALQRMQQATALEDRTEKHPVTPGEIIPAREQLADMLLQLNQPAPALAAYEANLRQHPNRFNGLYGAAVAAERAGQPVKAAAYFQQLTEVARAANSTRPELAVARAFLAKQKGPVI
ncbi:tetratricopeptide repeat protein [Hymenobacter jeollabukensis]|uniref:Tetratricopeptide repeat protein n=1 Tax=Hymenobacter jeollabukensis TaxID=2025313 RepID=A0A5R8WP07_9BACT|nr:hypothetical protein [Hymenobacter jeollabukensis]TLM91152.1 hypothetical protein FDY95_16285 [Hymenobacter jeollabukensis]